MKRRTSITLITRALLISVVLLAGNGTSYAQQSDIDAVKAAIAAYHAAIGPLAMSKMDPLWAHDANVMLLNPRDKSISVGWDAVNKAWETAGNFWSELNITQTDGPYVQVKGDVAWSTGTVNAVGKSKAGAAINAPTVETDVFERRGGAWLLVSHTASSRPR
jgi:ketosteroid isomerase-like protein